MSSFDNLPSEMKYYKQWVVWRFEESEGKKPSKIPYCPNWNTHASVTNPKTWGSFDDAKKAFDTGRFDGIGFVFTADDPFAGIDLDDTDGDEEAYARQIRIFQDFPGYAEYSPSGKGIHIIVRGAVERGRRRSKIEVYSTERFFTMTGNVYRSGNIEDCQSQLGVLYAAMGGAATIHEVGIDEPEREEDASILNRMFGAVNGDKARDLHEGRWDKHYQSQSEADFAYIDIVAFYTKNRFQITRIFQTLCVLGQRDKAKRIDYVYRMINRAFDRQLPPLDYEAMKIAYDELVARSAAEEAARGAGNDSANNGAAPPNKQGPGGPLPVGTADMSHDPFTVKIPGLVGEIAEFIFNAAPRPVYEIALAGAIALVAGIGGRAFNVSGMGLNQYIMLLAETGVGKEAAHSGISKLINAATPTTPHIGNFVGPSEIRSDAALLSWIANEPCILSVCGEFGLRLKQMSMPNAGSHEIGLRKVMLDLYSKSGHGEQLNSMAYADKTKNTQVVNSPSFTMLGESTPMRFYEALDENMAVEGLLPRFTFIEYKGARPKLNHYRTEQPTFALVDRFGSFAAQCSQLMAAQKVIVLKIDNQAKDLLHQFNEYCDAMWTKGGSRVNKEFWSRGHVKSMRLAATIAIGCNWVDPTIDRQMVQWACDMIVKDIASIVAKFDNGEIGGENPFGTDESKQRKDVIACWNKMLREPWDKCAKSYKLLEEMHKRGVMTHAALSEMVCPRASFRKDRRTATVALKAVIQQMIDADEIRQLSKDDVTTITGGANPKSYMIARPSIFIG